MITFENCQAALVASFAAAAALPGNILAGIPILSQPVSLDLATTMEPALREQGIGVAVVFPESGSSAANTDVYAITIQIPVMLCVNPTQLDSDTGLKVNFLAVIDGLFQATLRSPNGMGPQNFICSERSLQRVDEGDGMIVYLLSFDIQMIKHSGD